MLTGTLFQQIISSDKVADGHNYSKEGTTSDVAPPRQQAPQAKQFSSTRNYPQSSYAYYVAKNYQMNLQRRRKRVWNVVLVLCGFIFLVLARRKPHSLENGNASFV